MKYAFERGNVDGLLEHVVENAEACDLLATPPGERDQKGGTVCNKHADCLGELDAVHVRQPDIRDDDLGRDVASQRERLCSVVRDVGLIPPDAEEHGKPLGTFRVILDYEDTL